METFPTLPRQFVSNLIAKLNHVAEQTDACPSDNLHIQLRDVYTNCMELHVHSCTYLIWKRKKKKKIIAASLDQAFKW